MEQFGSGKFINLRNLLYILTPVFISFYLIYPLLNGDYLYPIAEYELYKSFMINFIDTLKKGELPLWNEYVGSGHPSLYFGHYPITQNTIIYMIFGFNDFTYYFTKFIGLVILFLSFIYACKYLRMTYLIALAGALAYFSINFVIRVLPAETIGNLLFVYPLLIIFIIKVIDEKKKKDILVFSLFYIFWLTGGHIIYVYMHMMILSIVYVISIFVFNGYEFKVERLKRFIPLYFILFIAPFLAVLYQYYFIYDVVSASNRLKEGFIASPFDAIVWTQFIASFQSSSYFLIGMFLSLLYAILRLLAVRYKFVNINIVISNWILLLIGVLFFLTVINAQFASKNSIISDLIPILNSKAFRIALLLYITAHFILNKMRYFFSYVNLNDIFILIVYIFLLSYYFYSPENIIGDVNGYDFDLFRELSVPLQILFILSVLFSVKYYTNNKAVKITVLSLIALYFIRSHLTIPMMRFTGIIWYAPRDGSIFSVFFAVLFMFGLKEMFFKLSYLLKERDKSLVKYIQYALLFLILLLFVRDSFDKFYKGTSHRFIYPNRSIAKTGTENGILNARDAGALLNNKLLELDKATKHFYRVFTPENNYIYLAGNMQHHKMHEAVIYESSISRELQDFYDYTVLGKTSSISKDLKAVMPYFLFTRHVHAGLNLHYRDIQYRDFFMFSPKDTTYLENQNIEFLWDLMQVKYLIIAPEFSKALEGFSNYKYYRLLGSYPKVNLNLYEVIKDKSYSKLAVMPLRDKQNYEDVVQQLNSEDINILKDLYSKMLFLDKYNNDFNIIKNYNSSVKRYYEIDSRQRAILIDFESWNHNWKLAVNNKEEQLQKAFQMFKGIKIEHGMNKIELTYHVKYFKELFYMGILVTLIYLVLLVRLYYIERNMRVKTAV